jgi:hypothetical protein
LTELRQEVSAYRKTYQTYDEAGTLVSQDLYVEEDMDIEVTYDSSAERSKIPMFLDPMNGTLKRQRRYADMSQLLDKLENR